MACAFMGNRQQSLYGIFKQPDNKCVLRLTDILFSGKSAEHTGSLFVLAKRKTKRKVLKLSQYAWQWRHPRKLVSRFLLNKRLVSTLQIFAYHVNSSLLVDFIKNVTSFRLQPVQQFRPIDHNSVRVLVFLQLHILTDNHGNAKR